MTQAENRKVILDNPTLPVYTYVASDVFGFDNDCNCRVCQNEEYKP
jgi:hypothetical protein